LGVCISTIHTPDELNMASFPRRLLARTLQDVTKVRPDELRRPVEPDVVPQEETRAAKCQVICIASGKGGTGKTVISTNLSVALVKMGLKVILLDADLGLANAHLLLGVEPSYDISAVVCGTKTIDEITVDCPAGVRLIAGGTGISELTELKEWQFKHLATELRSCEEHADVMLIDLAAGISSQVMRFLINAHDVIIVTTPDVTAQLDAYATIKTMARAKKGACVKVVINRARDEADAMATYKKMADIVRNRLPDVGIELLDWLPLNWYVQNSVHMRRPVVELHPKSFVTRTFLSMAGQLQESHLVWKRDVEVLASSPAAMGRMPPASFSQMLERINFR
jgi:flagellar biosynthesis protein FlhG